MTNQPEKMAEIEERETFIADRHIIEGTASTDALKTFRFIVCGKLSAKDHRKKI